MYCRELIAFVGQDRMTCRNGAVHSVIHNDVHTLRRLYPQFCPQRNVDNFQAPRAWVD